MQKDKPLVTVYMPTHNRSKLLSRAIESVLAQTYKNFELIIVDDCSTDNTEEVVRRYQAKDSRIIYIKNQSNLGACASRNKAIHIAKGEFITGLDDDDYFLPKRLEVFIKGWQQKHEDIILLYTWRGFLNEENQEIFKRPLIKKRGQVINQKDLLKNFYTGNQIFTSLKYMKEFGMFDERLLLWQDFDCYYRLLSQGKGKRINEFTYVVDMSHNYTRISDKDIDTVIENYNYFKHKNKIFNWYDVALLECHTYVYHKKLNKIAPSFIKLITFPSIFSFKQYIQALTNMFNRSN